VTPTKVRWAIHASIAGALFAVPYKYWLTTPVLHYVSIGYWRLLAILIAATFGILLLLLRVSISALSCGAMAGLLIGGTFAAWQAPNDIAISLYGVFASHLQSFWREILVLTSTATLAALSCDYIRKRRVRVPLPRPHNRKRR
jgi:hypothetical protein